MSTKTTSEDTNDLDDNNNRKTISWDEEIIKEADYIIDIGPKAGINGGNIVAQGNFKDFINQNSLTAHYIGKKAKIELPKNRRKWS